MLNLVVAQILVRMSLALLSLIMGLELIVRMQLSG